MNRTYYWLFRARGSVHTRETASSEKCSKRHYVMYLWGPGHQKHRFVMVDCLGRALWPDPGHPAPRPRRKVGGCVPIPAKVPVLRASWSLLHASWDILTASWDVPVDAFHWLHFYTSGFKDSCQHDTPVDWSPEDRPKKLIGAACRCPCGPNGFAPGKHFHRKSEKWMMAKGEGGQK